WTTGISSFFGWPVGMPMDLIGYNLVDEDPASVTVLIDCDDGNIKAARPMNPFMGSLGSHAVTHAYSTQAGSVYHIPRIQATDHLGQSSGWIASTGFEQYLQPGFAIKVPPPCLGHDLAGGIFMPLPGWEAVKQPSLNVNE